MFHDEHTYVHRGAWRCDAPIAMHASERHPEWTARRSGAAVAAGRLTIGRNDFADSCSQPHHTIHTVVIDRLEASRDTRRHLATAAVAAAAAAAERLRWLTVELRLRSNRLNVEQRIDKLCMHTMKQHVSERMECRCGAGSLLVSRG